MRLAHHRVSRGQAAGPARPGDHRHVEHHAERHHHRHPSAPGDHRHAEHHAERHHHRHPSAPADHRHAAHRAEHHHRRQPTARRPQAARAHNGPRAMAVLQRRSSNANRARWQDDAWGPRPSAVPLRRRRRRAGPVHSFARRQSSLAGPEILSGPVWTSIRLRNRNCGPGRSRWNGPRFVLARRVRMWRERHVGPIGPGATKTKTKSVRASCQPTARRPSFSPTRPPRHLLLTHLNGTDPGDLQRALGAVRPTTQPKTTFGPTEVGPNERNPATSYSPRANPPKYHRR